MANDLTVVLWSIQISNKEKEEREACEKSATGMMLNLHKFYEHLRMSARKTMLSIWVCEAYV